MARLITNTTYKTPDGWTYRLELINGNLAPSSFTPFTSIEIAQPGFTIDWKGGINDILQPIMASSMSFSAYLTEAERTHITSQVYGDKEFVMWVRLYRSTDAQETLEWAGIIHPEETTEEINDGRILTTFVASDGIAALKNVDFKDANENPYYTDVNTSERALIYWLKEIVNKLPHWGILDDHIGTTHPMFTEHRLVRPVNATYNTFPSNDAVLDHYFLKGDSFYVKPKPSESRKKGFDRLRTERRTNFVSTYDALSEICSSLGATFCFSEGKFHLFDRERIIRGNDDDIGYFNWTKDSNGLFSHAAVVNSSGAAEGADLQLVELDHIKANFLQGAIRRGVYPVESVSQTHEGAGSDLIFRSGIGFDGPNFETFLHRLEDIDANTPGLYAITTSNPYSNIPPNGIVEDLDIPNGTNEGSFRLHFSGDAKYYNSGLGHEPGNRGNLAVLRLDVKVYDGSNWFRLKRRVRSLPYLSNGDAFGLSVPNASINDKYIPKTYDQYSWVRDDADGYEFSFLEVMIGADPTVLTDDFAGDTDEILQSQEFSHVYYTPPLLKQGSGDLELVQDDLRSRFIYRFDEEIQMPTIGEGASGSFGKLQITPVLRLYEIPFDEPWQKLIDSNGVSQAVGNDNAFGGSWPLVTASVAGGTATGSNYNEAYSLLEEFQLSGIEVYLGDGTENYDANYVSSSSVVNGSEIVSLEPTAFGATFENSGNRAFGRYRATHPDASSTKEDNLKFHPDGLGSSIAFADMYTSLGSYTTARALSIRNKTRHSVSGTIIRRDPNSVGLDVCRPYKKFSTRQLSGDLEFFLPHALTIEVDNHAQRVEALRCAVESEIPVLEEASDTGRNPNRPPGNGNGGFAPGGDVNHIYGKTTALSTDVIGLEAEVDAIDTVVDAIAEVIKATTGGGGKGVYTDSAKGTTSSYMGLSSTSATLQAGGGNTALNLLESSPGRMTMKVQVGPTGSEASTTAIDIQGQTGTQLPDIVFNGNVSGIDVGDLDDVTTTGVQTDQVLAWNGTNFVPVDQTGGGGASDTTEIELKMIFLEQ
tara:strand:+ start:10730 stop:13855 length:3126 start_codon:yes stop_codon:yes gene_type:complete